MKKHNIKKQLFSLTTTSALVLSSLAGVAVPMVHAEQKGAKEDVMVSSSKEIKEDKKNEETLITNTAETKSTKAVQEQKNTTADALQQATRTVNNLFDRFGAKQSNTKAQIDAARKQVTALSNSMQKTELLNKVEQAQQAYDELMKKWQEINTEMDQFFINGEIGNPRSSVTQTDIDRLGEKLFEFPLEKPFLEGYTTDKLRDKLNQLIYVLDATPKVSWLFIDGKPNPENTQWVITDTLNSVNQMFDGPYKQNLLEKIEEAQQAYEETSGIAIPPIKQATRAVNQLFNGNTPKESNTQEKIDSARKKVEAIKGHATVKAKLLEKVKIAQAALDNKKTAITVDDYYCGNVYMTGKYSGNIKKFKLIVDGKEYNPGFKLLKNNCFELYIGKRITKATKTVKVESLDETGKVTGTQEISVQSSKLTAENYALGQEYIKGQMFGEAKQFKLMVDGKEFSAGFKLLANNHFEVYAKNKIQSNSKTAMLKVLNGEGTEVATQEITIQKPSLNVNHYKVNTDYITGTHTGDVKKFKLIVDGQEYFPGFKLLANDQFEVYAKNKVSSSSKLITLISLDAKGKEIQRQEVSHS
ncbi:immunoglobulin-like domain-containing protein [Enterococcus ratti]